MTEGGLSSIEALKFTLLADGVEVGDDAREFLLGATQGRDLTPADYASTSGLILVLGEDVWVNAPIAAHNPSFVSSPPHRLVLVDGSLVVRTRGQDVPARFWVPPLYHQRRNPWGEPYTSYSFTHTDRVRVSPIEGCAMTCKFCDLPYEFRYRRKRVEGLVDAVRAARDDETQPAAHVLISGGVPRPDDYEYLVEAFEAVLAAVPNMAVDIMMVPIPEVWPLEELDRLGLAEVSINLELFGPDAAKKYMRRKFDQGRPHYLSFLEHAASILGGPRVRSMLMVGLEPVEDTLAGVRAIAERGCVPVLSPFRPDESTPLRDLAPPTAEFLTDVYLRSRDITQELGVPLGPGCVPCSHNTLTLAASGAGDAAGFHGRPVLV